MSNKSVFITQDQTKTDVRFKVPNETDDESDIVKNDSDIDEEDDYSGNNGRPISAVAPKIQQRDERQIEISSTPAFQSLEELFQMGKITGTQMAQLKSKYVELHESLKKSRSNEIKLLKQCKDCVNKLEANQEILDKAELFPDNLSNLSSEVMKLRAQYLKYSNDVDGLIEREYELQYKITGLEEDKKLLEREFARMPKVHELERRIQELEMGKSDLIKEISHRKEEINDLKDALAKRQVEIDGKAKEYKESLQNVDSTKVDLFNVNSLINQITRECDKIVNEIEDLRKEKEQLEVECGQVMDNNNVLDGKRQDVENRKLEVNASINKQKNMMFVKDKDYNDLHKQLDLEKEKETVLLADKATLELSLRHSLFEKKGEYEALMRAQKDKEREFKNYKRAELQLRSAQDSLTNVKFVLDKVLLRQEQHPFDDMTLFEKRKELTKEVDQLKRNLTLQQSLTAIEKVKVEKNIEEEEHLLCEQSDYRVEAVEVTRLAAIKSDEREQKAREHMKAETRYRRALEDLKTKDLIIEDHKKKYREMKLKIREHAKMYDIIKNERNKCVNKIQVSTQRASEMREKIKILQNEIEILRTASLQKEKRLQKQHLKYTNAMVIRDSIRNEVAKQKKIAADLHEVQEQQKLNIGIYNTLSVQNEHEAVKLRKKYDETVKTRNERGIELITRSEEVCVLCERLNVQEGMLRNADIELQTKEEEIRFLKLQLNEEKRQLSLLHRDLPNKEALDDELQTMQTQLQQCQARLVELERDVQDSSNPERINFLDGKEETPDQIMKRLEQLEVKLAKKEEQCLEKDLILEQVCRLSDRITNKVETSKEDTLELAKKVNEIQSKIKEATRKMMATVSELSIAQAEALTLQEEVKTKELELEQSYIRMEKGEPPNEDLERDWLRMIQNEERQKLDKLNQQIQEEQVKLHVLPNGTVTTAEPRPNAYIPQEINELPIPRPYGVLAPFKPTEKGTTMRHIKKPNPKPIEI